MEPDLPNDRAIASSNGDWWRRQTHDYYSYHLDEDGLIQKIFHDPNTEVRYGKGRAKTPPGKGGLKRDNSPVAGKSARGMTPVSFQTPARPPKYFMEGKAATVVSGDTFGPTKLETSQFRSHNSEGETAWHYSQAPYDLDAPLPETAIPRMLGTVYVHRNVSDGGYQVWVWYDREGRGLLWQPVDLNNEQVPHPKISERSLKLTSTGKPSWILNSTATTYRSRSLKRSRSQSAVPISTGNAPIADSISTGS
ncbi:hypothetical protein EV361DRAFT_926988 [Lentinula raphanica]|nr:hypothetical protein EV361DRAFT_926988 [Lentinula raphanica]